MVMFIGERKQLRSVLMDCLNFSTDMGHIQGFFSVAEQNMLFVFELVNLELILVILSTVQRSQKPRQRKALTVRRKLKVSIQL